MVIIWYFQKHFLSLQCSNLKISIMKTSDCNVQRLRILKNRLDTALYELTYVGGSALLLPDDELSILLDMQTTLSSLCLSVRARYEKVLRDNLK